MSAYAKTPGHEDVLADASAYPRTICREPPAADCVMLPLYVHAIADGATSWLCVTARAFPEEDVEVMRANTYSGPDGRERVHGSTARLTAVPANDAPVTVHAMLAEADVMKAKLAAAVA
jgi:hypothetical protein